MEFVDSIRGRALMACLGGKFAGARQSIPRGRKFAVCRIISFLGEICDFARVRYTPRNLALRHDECSNKQVEGALRGIVAGCAHHDLAIQPRILVSAIVCNHRNDATLAAQTLAWHAGESTGFLFEDKSCAPEESISTA